MGATRLAELPELRDEGVGRNAPSAISTELEVLCWRFCTPPVRLSIRGERGRRPLKGREKQPQKEGRL